MYKEANTSKTHRKLTCTARILRAALLTLIIYVMVSAAGTAAFFGIFFARRGAEQGSVELVYTEERERAYPRRDISFESGKNTLRGYLYGEDGALGLVIIANGFNSGAGSHMPEALYFVDKGWAVLIFDGTGVRRSDGNSVVGLAQMAVDLDAALDFVSRDEYLGGLPTVVYGHSMGAYAAARVTAEHTEIAAVACVAGFNSPVDLMTQLGIDRVGIATYIEYPFLYAYNELLFGSTVDITAAEALAQSGVPALLIDADSDDVVLYTASISAGMEDVSGGTVTVMEVGGGHSGCWLTDEAASARTAAKNELESLRSEYGGDIPREIMDDFYKRWDMDSMNEVDTDFMDAVNRFFLEHAK